MHLNKNGNDSGPKGRKRTDKSLSDERARTDDALSEGRKQTELQADLAVSAGRAEADESKSIERIDADEANEVDDRLAQERQNADAALESERRHMDSVLMHERSEKKAVQDKLFQNERKETDKNLTDERKQTDFEVTFAAKTLSEEKSSHTATRAALTTRDEFLAIVSHDLRNPLGSISMAVELIKEKAIYTDSDDETREYLDMIGRNAAEALRLIGDLLDMERIAAGKLGLSMESHDVAEIMRHAIKTFERQAFAKDISLKMSPAVKTLVTCDRDRISQVLSNLIGNALKFTPSAGSITLTLQKNDLEVQIAVTDTGPGIPEDMRKVIFERFWQISKSDRRGLGLGLYIATMIVETHGGRIWVDSKVGQGSCFHFTLPAH